MKNKPIDSINKTLANNYGIISMYVGYIGFLQWYFFPIFNFFTIIAGVTLFTYGILDIKHSNDSLEGAIGLCLGLFIILMWIVFWGLPLLQAILLMMFYTF